MICVPVLECMRCGNQLLSAEINAKRALCEPCYKLRQEEKHSKDMAKRLAALDEMVRINQEAGLYD